MPLLFTQARNGTVSINRGLTQEEAEAAKDIALGGPETRATAMAKQAFIEDMSDQSIDYFRTHQRAEHFFHRNARFNGNINYNSGEITVSLNSTETFESPYDIVKAVVY